MSIPFICGITILAITIMGALKSYKFPLLVFIAYQPFNIYVQGLRDKQEMINPVNGLILLIIGSYFLTGSGNYSSDEDHKEINSPRIKKPLIIFITIIVLYSLYSRYFSGLDYFFLNEGGFSFTKVWITPMIMYFVYYYSFKSTEEKKIILGIMVVTSLIMAIDAIWEYKIIGGYDDDKRIGGLIGQANELSVFLVIYTFVYAALLWCKDIPKVSRALIGLVVLFSSIATGFTLSRGAYLAFAVGSIVFLFFKSKKLLLVIIVVAFIFGTMLIPKDMLRRIEASKVETYYGETELDNSAASRLEIWNASIEIVKKHPFGIGLGLIPYYMNKEIGTTLDTHNIYFHVLVQFGITGFAVFCWLIYALLINGIRKIRETEDDFEKCLAFGFNICAIALMVRGLTGNHFINAETYNNFWVLAALVHNSTGQQ